MQSRFSERNLGSGRMTLAALRLGMLTDDDSADKEGLFGAHTTIPLPCLHTHRAVNVIVERSQA